MILFAEVPRRGRGRTAERKCRALKGLIFDLDGVLVDTAKYHYLAWREIAQELGIPFDEEDNERLKGVSRMRSFEIILEIGGRQMEEAEKERYCAKKNERYLTYIKKMPKSEILPGVRPFLGDARRAGYKIALGSASKNSRLILERLELTDCFDAVIDGTKVQKAKPDPEVFLKGAQELGLSPAECVVFEDSQAGLEAAHAGGMRAVGIGSRDRLPQADLCLPGFEGVTTEQLERMLAGV